LNTEHTIFKTGGTKEENRKRWESDLVWSDMDRYGGNWERLGAVLETTN